MMIRWRIRWLSVRWDVVYGVALAVLLTFAVVAALIQSQGSRPEKSKAVLNQPATAPGQPVKQCD